ncbi:hypothetical protein KL943_004680 [Ogataea angusta]|nr:hypothetical protein KL943_004680 [Ogataea angusta]
MSHGDPNTFGAANYRASNDFVDLVDLDSVDDPFRDPAPEPASSAAAFANVANDYDAAGPLHDNPFDSDVLSDYESDNYGPAGSSGGLRSVHAAAGTSHRHGQRVRHPPVLPQAQQHRRHEPAHDLHQRPADKRTARLLRQPHQHHQVQLRHVCAQVPVRAVFQVREPVFPVHVGDPAGPVRVSDQQVHHDRHADGGAACFGRQGDHRGHQAQLVRQRAEPVQNRGSGPPNGPVRDEKMDQRQSRRHRQGEQRGAVSRGPDPAELVRAGRAVLHRDGEPGRRNEPENQAVSRGDRRADVAAAAGPMPGQNPQRAAQQQSVHVRGYAVPERARDPAEPGPAASARRQSAQHGLDPGNRGVHGPRDEADAQRDGGADQEDRRRADHQSAGDCAVWHSAGVVGGLVARRHSQHRLHEKPSGLPLSGRNEQGEAVFRRHPDVLGAFLEPRADLAVCHR